MLNNKSNIKYKKISGIADLIKFTSLNNNVKDITAQCTITAKMAQVL